MSRRSPHAASRSRAASHLVAVVGSLLLVGVAIAAGASMRTASLLEPDTTIAVEHAGRASVIVTVGEGTLPSLVEITQEENPELHIHVPETWKLREVRGGPLSGAARGAAAMGFVRWRVPAHVVLSFTVPSASVGPVRVLHASSGSLELRMTRMHLPSGEKQQETALLQGGWTMLP